MSYGGDIEDSDPSVKAGTKREITEESGFVVEEQDMEVMAEILVIDEKGPRLILYYVLARTWRGEPSRCECEDGTTADRHAASIGWMVNGLFSLSSDGRGVARRAVRRKRSAVPFRAKGRTIRLNPDEPRPAGKAPPPAGHREAGPEG